MSTELESILVAFGHVLPVNDVPDSLEVVRTHILVLEVVGVLPDINTKDGGEIYG